MRNRTQKGITLLVGTVSLVFIVPMIGLAVDVGFLYATRSKLQAAVDGAALAAARALSIGVGLTAQTTSAQNNAVNWFYANFPNGTFGTTGTVMTTSNVSVTVDAHNAQLLDVAVNATTQVDTFFMKFLGFGATTVGANGTASRRTVVAVLVLDRSGSMCLSGGTQHSPCASSGNTYPCTSMVSAAKAFTGQFAEGTDYIGLVSFADNVYIHSPPVTNFQSVLGYTNSSGSGNGTSPNSISSINCNGGTSTAEGIAMAYQLLYQTNLPGALNVIALETDGMPDWLVMNFYDSTNKLPGLTSNSTCTDTNNKTWANGGFSKASYAPNWTYGLAMNGSNGHTNGFVNATGYYSDIPAGMIMSVGSTGDPTTGSNFFTPEGYWSNVNTSTSTTPGQFTGNSSDPYNTGSYSNTNNISPAGCGSANGQTTTKPTDIGWFPSTDVFGNSLNPSYAYQTVSTDSYGHIKQSGSSPGNYNNYHAAVLNATDSVAYNVRTNSTIPATVFVVGLGGNATMDPILLQRMANDPNGDEFNTTGPDTGGAYYLPCAQETGCVTYSSQPQGTFIYAPTTAYLAEAFLRISSQVLRLSK